MMMTWISRWAALLLLVCAAPVVAEPQPAPLAELVQRVDIAYESFALNNGLTVVVHTDRKAPLVAVGVWYRVGARDEPKGRSGFAHLFEHIMFRGSEHSRQDHFRPLEDVGATDLNGTTDFDRTNYYQTVPTPALDLALFLESDRMGWLLPALSDDVLASERGIVLNEKLQSENQPGGLVLPALLARLFPADHPYGVSPIGQEADLNAATVADAKHWFHSHYGPNNAVLVLAGDIDVATARPMVERWFGQIPPGPTPARFAAPPPARTATTRETLHDKVATARLIRAWALPHRDAPGMADLDVGLATLGSGPTSLLFDRLVRQERLAVGVSASMSSWEGAGIATVAIDVRPGVEPAAAEARADALIAQWLAAGPEADEVARVATRTVSAIIRGLERVGGGGGKASALAAGALFAGDPGRYRRDLAELAAVTPASVRAAAQRYLRAGDHRITLLPGERDPASIAIHQQARVEATPAMAAPATFAAQGQPADRSTPPAGGEVVALTVPAIERAVLANGMAVELVRNSAVPVVRMQMVLPEGVPADSVEKPGTQRLMLGMLREGSNGRLGPLDGPEIARRLERLGAAVGASAGLDTTRFSLNALTVNLQPSLLLFADLLRHPAFDAEQLERVRGQVLASLANETVNPNGIALRAAPALFYGPRHPYGRSFSGNGTAAGVQAVTRADLAAFHAETVHPSRATLFVAGDIDMATLKPLLEQTLGDWRTTPPDRITATVMPQAQPEAPGKVIVFDRPASPQSVIVAGAPLPLTGRDDYLALSLANDVFGGSFTARLNKLLREQKGWTYGAHSSLTATRFDMPWLLTAPVETPRTADSIAAIRRLLTAFHTDKPAEAAEVARAQASAVRALPGQFETAADMLGAMERAHTLGRPDDYLATLPSRVMAISLDEVHAAPIPTATELTFIIVGDRAQVEPQLQAANLAYEVRELPTD